MCGVAAAANVAECSPKEEAEQHVQAVVRAIRRDDLRGAWALMKQVCSYEVQPCGNKVVFTSHFGGTSAALKQHMEEFKEVDLQQGGAW